MHLQCARRWFGGCDEEYEFDPFKDLSAKRDTCPCWGCERKWALYRVPSWEDPEYEDTNDPSEPTIQTWGYQEFYLPTDVGVLVPDYIQKTLDDINDHDIERLPLPWDKFNNFQVLEPCMRGKGREFVQLAFSDLSEKFRWMRDRGLIEVNASLDLIEVNPGGNTQTFYRRTAGKLCPLLIPPHLLMISTDDELAKLRRIEDHISLRV